MSRTRLFIAEPLSAHRELTLDAERGRYLGKVLRLKKGDSLQVFNGEEGEFHATVSSVGKSGVKLQTGEQCAVHVESPLKVHLVQGVSRGERMDLVIQKATELGVKRISPVVTAHGVVKLNATRAARRRDHWQKIAESACEQSGRIRPPLIDLPLPLKSWLGQRSPRADTDIVLHPAAASALVALGRPATKLCILVGPEGGLSEAEVDGARVAGFRAVSLGPRILRTETAAIAALAIAQALWGDLRLD